jgi:hypothetical protein
LGGGERRAWFADALASGGAVVGGRSICRRRHADLEQFFVSPKSIVLNTYITKSI